MRRALVSILLIAGACSASPSGNGQSVPRNSPLETDIVNVPATTGRANLKPTAPPFKTAIIGTFDDPFAMAFLPDDDGILVTEKAGHLRLRFPSGVIKNVTGVPRVATGGQGGLLDVAVSPDYGKRDYGIYLTYAEPAATGSQLVLARASLDAHGAACFPPRCPSPEELEYELNNFQVIWRSGSSGPGGQFGANILFSPDGQYLFLSSGERQRFTPAQDPKQALGKILRLTLDGKPAPGNPMFAKGGVEAMTWSTGHRNPYGMVFTPDGRLWEEEMGPRGGDELNLIVAGRNYGWPIVSNGDNYSGQPIPDHPSRPEFEPPKLWWNPSISPGGMIYYSGAMFPQYRGSLLIAALSDESLIRVKLNGDTATAADQWSMGERIRDVAQAPDGSIWLLQDDGKLVRLTPRA